MVTKHEAGISGTECAADEADSNSKNREKGGDDDSHDLIAGCYVP